MSAIIFHHPKHDAILHDPRDPIVARPRYEQLTEDELARLYAVEMLERVADRLGSYRRVQNVLKTVAMIHGEAL